MPSIPSRLGALLLTALYLGGSPAALLAVARDRWRGLRVERVVDRPLGRDHRMHAMVMVAGSGQRMLMVHVSVRREGGG